MRASKKIVRDDKTPRKIRYVAGVDVAYTQDLSIGAVAVLNYTTLDIIESKTSNVKTKFPYIPTLLSFREISPAISAIRKLTIQPDIYMVDGHGILHPNGLGFASHLGLVLDKPTIGVAKKPLTGEIGRFNPENWAPIQIKNEIAGAVLKARGNASPIYVSVGHLISLEKAIKIVKQCNSDYKIPRPIHIAHNLATLTKKTCK